MNRWKRVPVEPTYQMSEAMGVKWEQGDGFPARWKAALAAAPTPPVSIHDRDIKDIIGEWLAGIVSSDNALEEIRAMITDVPTPPAQEDEPAAWYFRFNNGESRFTWDKLQAADIRRYLEVDETETPLYTRPDDKLRKAAKEALEVLENYHASETDIASVMKNLRAALEQK